MTRWLVAFLVILAGCSRRCDVDAQRDSTLILGCGAIDCAAAGKDWLCTCRNPAFTRVAYCPREKSEPCRLWTPTAEAAP